MPHLRLARVADCFAVCVFSILTTLCAVGPASAAADSAAADIDTADTGRLLPASLKSHAPARLAIVIDDIGWDRRLGEAAIELPGRLTMAVIPHTPNGPLLARYAHASGQEVILHQPMQGSDFTHAANAIKGTMTMAMGPADIGSALDTALASVPHCVGINNHTGSILTGARSHMYWLMQQVATNGALYYLDSRTTAKTVAGEAARAWGVPFVSRDVFLDHEDTRSAVERQFNRALSLARRRGHAVLIAHPRPLSIALLQRRLAALDPNDVELVHASELIDAPSRWDTGLTAAGQ